MPNHSHEGLISLLGANKEFCLHLVEVLAKEVGELRSRLPREASSVTKGVSLHDDGMTRAGTGNN